MDFDKIKDCNFLDCGSDVTCSTDGYEDYDIFNQL